MLDRRFWFYCYPTVIEICVKEILSNITQISHFTSERKFIWLVLLILMQLSSLDLILSNSCPSISRFSVYHPLDFYAFLINRIWWILRFYIVTPWLRLKSQHFVNIFVNQSINQSNFDPGFIPLAGIYPTLTAISPTPTLHLARFKVSSFSKPTLLLSFSTCIFHAFFGCPHFLLPFTSNSNAFVKTCPSSLLNTCSYPLTPFAFAIWTTVCFLQSQHLH